jgi:hypothetical protein
VCDCVYLLNTLETQRYGQCEYNSVCVYKGVQLKSIVQHIAACAAAALPPCRLCYRPTVFCGYLNIIAHSFSMHLKIYFNFVFLFKNALVGDCKRSNSVLDGALICFPNALFAILRYSLTIMLIYCNFCKTSFCRIVL